MTARGIGPLRESTSATEAELRALFPAQRVVLRDLGDSSGLVFDILDGSERLFYVVPDDAEGFANDGESRYADTIFAVFAVSPRVAVDGRTWRVGEPFTDDAGIDRCECWGDGEVTACFKIGSRLRVIFDDACATAKTAGASAMRGKRIARLMWKRELEPAGLLDD